ncbi:uncharacterized protein LY79DRAFT_555536 [Colletotrichum navitas]|uniref:Uncharacterized protein n=1 Tax=Colletotrichum navitas TaxID=681940 RepID=A0AAD8V2M6_9PEZI|nr:uncharacterized protein LY79DRAFT_555536 [Colletotrichum navitas]KAK1589995.1 hypothetical protein LY79DRAFT_555536 [Colletotrichum navitas]
MQPTAGFHEAEVAPVIPYPSRRTEHWRARGWTPERSRGLAGRILGKLTVIVTTSVVYPPPALPALVGVSYRWGHLPLSPLETLCALRFFISWPDCPAGSTTPERPECQISFQRPTASLPSSSSMSRRSPLSAIKTKVKRAQPSSESHSCETANQRLPICDPICRFLARLFAIRQEKDRIAGYGRAF